MVGRTYIERGREVVVLKRWEGTQCPRNVLIRREDGTLVVRPFRGLRRTPSGSQEQLFDKGSTMRGGT